MAKGGGGVPLATGSLGYAPQSEGGLADVFGGTTTDALREEQLKKLLQQSQMYQATAAQRQNIGQQVAQDPSKANDKHLEQVLRALYQGTGMRAPIDPYTPAQKGVAPTAAHPDNGPTPTGPHGMEQAASLSDPMAGYPGSPGTPDTPAKGGINANALYTPDPKLIEQRDKVFEENFTKRIDRVINEGVPGKIEATVNSAIAEARANGWTDERIHSTLDPYLQSSVAALSPMTISRIARNKSAASMTAEEKQLYAARVNEVNSQTALNHEHVQHLKDLQDNFMKMLGPKDKALAAQTSLALQRVSTLVDQGDLFHQEADWYGRRTDQIAANRGQNPQEYDTALRSISSAMDNSATVIRGYQASLATMQSSMAAMTQAGRDAQQPLVQQIQDSIRMEANRYNGYAAQQNALLQGGNFYQPGSMNFTPTYNPDGTISKQTTGTPPVPGAQTSDKPAMGGAAQHHMQKQANPQALPPTKVNPNNGKTYYLWKSDNNYHPTRES
jgi:hypothetical protein